MDNGSTVPKVIVQTSEQTAYTLIRCHKMQHLIRGYTVCVTHPVVFSTHQQVELTKYGVQGPVVQSIVSLTSSLRVISLTVLAGSIYNILIFFAEKM